MASRNELVMIRAARAGKANAQLALGRRYLFGGSGLPRSPATALYWLDRAAHQQEPDAWMLIGRHVPFEVARQSSRPGHLSIWYERAYDAGLAEAGLVYARLVLQLARQATDTAERRKALAALETAAQAGIAEAQWLLARQLGNAEGEGEGVSAAGTAAADVPAAGAVPRLNAAALCWTSRAAEGGVAAAQRALAEHAWSSGDHAEFLRWGLPLARQLTAKLEISEFVARQLPAVDISLLSRCAQALMPGAKTAPAECELFLYLAAWARDREAQYHLGLWYAKLDTAGRRLTQAPGAAHYKKAIRWLTLAGEQGLAKACFTLSRIYLKPECSQRSLADSRRYLLRAAEAGHREAQAEFGMLKWRRRKDHADADIEAVAWLQKAAAQGQGEAAALLKRITLSAAPAAWAAAARARLTREQLNLHPFLAGRLELAAEFGLARAEALLLDVQSADCGHCLLIDVRAQRPRSVRRLISLQTAGQRSLLDRVLRLFDNVDCGPQGPEGSYRQRLYRLKMLGA